MSVSNGQKGNQSVLNAAFASKTADNSMLGNQSLEDPDAASGASVTNVQRSLNGQASFTGADPVGTYNQSPTWDSNAIGVASESVKDRVDAVQAEVEVNQADIDDLETLSGSPGLTAHASFTGTTIPDSSTTKAALQFLETAVEARIPSTEKGAVNGVCPLNGSGKIDSTYLTVEAMEYKGTWNANTNTPTLADGVGNTGDVYLVSVAGTQDLGSGSVSYEVDDRIIYDGSVWDKWTSSGDFAAKDLSNLTSPTAINQDLLPDVDDSRTIGSQSLAFTSMTARLLNAANTTTNQITGRLSGNNGQTTPSSATVVAGVYTENVTEPDLGVYTQSNNTADANRTGDVYIETGNKSAGTGDSGSVVLQTGTSSGGSRGEIQLKNGSEGTSGHVWTSTGTAGEGSWQASGSGGDASYVFQNLGLANSVAASALTINLKQSDASTDPTSGNPTKISFRSSTAGSGLYNIRSVTSSLSVVVPSGATLGHGSATLEYMYIYALDNAGTVELAVSSMYYDEGELQSTTAIGAGSDANGLYSTSARSNVPIRLLARCKSNQTTAGTWAATLSEISLVTPALDIVPLDVRSSTAAFASYGGTVNQWYDLTSITLGPGKWHIEVFTSGSSSGTAQTHRLGLSTTSGNVSPGSEGIDYVRESIPASSIGGMNFFYTEEEVTTSTTWYAKYYTDGSASISVGYTMKAWRVK